MYSRASALVSRKWSTAFDAFEGALVGVPPVVAHVVARAALAYTRPNEWLVLAHTSRTFYEAIMFTIDWLAPVVSPARTLRDIRTAWRWLEPFLEKPARGMLPPPMCPWCGCASERYYRDAMIIHERNRYVMAPPNALGVALSAVPQMEPARPTGLPLTAGALENRPTAKPPGHSHFHDGDASDSAETRAIRIPRAFDVRLGHARARLRPALTRKRPRSLEDPRRPRRASTRPHARRRVQPENARQGNHVCTADGELERARHGQATTGPRPVGGGHLGVGVATGPGVQNAPATET